MTTGSLTRRLCLMALATLYVVNSAATLRAEPITVTSGVFFTPEDEPGGFLFFGADGFVLLAGFPFLASSPFLTCLRGCAPGTALSLSTVVGGESIPNRLISERSFEATIHGTKFVAPVLTGTLRFDAPTVVLPPVDSIHGTGISAPFVFNGDVTGFAANDRDMLMPLFHVALTGQGTAQVGFEPLADFFPAPEVTYTFAPTPEPTTLALLATGLIGVVARRRTSRKAGTR